jgi:hypothetical protein
VVKSEKTFEFEDCDDLTKFYKMIYEPKIQGFALKFSVVGSQVTFKFF